MQKLAIAIAGVIACLCIGLGIFGAMAYADTDNSSLTPDKSEIQAVVEQDGSITLDTCTLTNTYTNKLQLQSSMVSIADDVKEIKALENCVINITSDNETTIYSGNPNGAPQCIYDFILDSNDRFTFNFKIEYLDTDTVIALCDKNVFTLSFQTACFYNIVTETDGHGTLTCDHPDGATAGTQVTLTPTSDPDHEFDSYETTPELTITDNKFIMPASDVTIKAKFKLITHTITLQTDGHGTLTCDHPDGATAGTQVTLTPAPSTDYELDSYETNPSTLVIGTDNKFTMPASDVTIKAKFKLITHTIILQTDGHGTLTCDHPDGASAGTQVTLTPESSTDYELDSYETNPSTLVIGTDNKFTMPASNVTITAKFKESEPVTWIPMQAKANAEDKPIDFYPAFSTTDQIAGYKFATYDGTDYHEIQNITSMSDIYSALQPSTGAKTTTLYYQKTSSDAQDLKSYTVKDLTWNYVFGAGTATSGGVAEAYSDEFIAGYQHDVETDNGIKTALLATDGFGSEWNQQTDIPKLVNDVQYIDQTGSDPSLNGGFYGCYGGRYGGLLSSDSAWPFGSCAFDSYKAYYFYVFLSEWNLASRGSKDGVVLARAFN